MLEPTGPLPPEIYWRRRLLAIAALVIALVVVIALAFFLLHKGGKDDSAAAASTSGSTAAKPAATSSGTAAAGTSASGTVSASASVNAAASGSPAPCPDQSLAVKVSVAQPNYKSGEQPVFHIVVTNISTASCTRDMGSGLQQVWVQSLDGQRKLWSSTDCDQGGPADLRTLGGGQQAEFTLTWSGTTSQANCAGERVPVPPGGYAVVAQFGSVRSSPEPFNIA
ncbi:DUF4232 domain-containing protein [Nocardia pseudobrasiliensis]|uniref:Uncharacterized protein DUF4232 n=1 Tax=Nocardia pseudobrasiliensis TaxID=45979 RepID=A0A370I5X7_9NOCA|nr:DUF4232 domain-containing protein [Nocardia pseudobrasiliensis]RDI66109.1 uncharacterized protein DUF4232 [Nocardia pseudobrasiliensis]